MLVMLGTIQLEFLKKSQVQVHNLQMKTTKSSQVQITNFQDRPDICYIALFEEGRVSSNKTSEH